MIEKSEIVSIEKKYDADYLKQIKRSITSPDFCSRKNRTITARRHCNAPGRGPGLQAG